MFTKTNGQLPNIDYDDGQNRLVDKVVLQVCVCSSKNNQIRPGKVPTINKLKRTNENPETLKCLKF